MPTGGEISPGERVLGGLLDQSHKLRPDQIPAVADERARLLGAVDATVYVVDMNQRWLVDLGNPDDRLDIDGTLAGRAYRTRETQEAGGSHWIPMLDGADRVGILHASLPDDADDTLRARLRWLASILAELIVSKSQYGDDIVLAKRTQQMALAAELRWALLPPLTFRNEHVEIAAMLEPAYSVAGDAFDHSVGADEVHIALFDAMGHGLEATRMANLAIAVYRNARRNGSALSEVARFVDGVLAEEFGSECFVTALLVVLDMRTGAVRFVCAGHPLPLHLRGTHVISEVDGVITPPLGLRNPTPQSSELQLEVGDRLLLFTDGVTEAEGINGEPFGVERLGRLLEQAAMASEIPAETARRLTHSVLAHAPVLRDDATLLLLGWPAAKADQ